MSWWEVGRWVGRAVHFFSICTLAGTHSGNIVVVVVVVVVVVMNVVVALNVVMMVVVDVVVVVVIMGTVVAVVGLVEIDEKAAGKGRLVV